MFCECYQCTVCSLVVIYMMSDWNIKNLVSHIYVGIKLYNATFMEITSREYVAVMRK